MSEALFAVQTIISLAAKLSVPVYVILQLWLPFRWSGGWRIATLFPMVVMLPSLGSSLYALYTASVNSNLGLILLILLAPPCCLYLLALVALHRAGRPLRRPDEDDDDRPLRQAGGHRGGYTR
jgi:hypothetical protein